MNIASLVHADIFFFITTIAVIVVTVVLAWAGIYLIQALRNFRDISRTLKKGVDSAGQEIGNVYHDIDQSPVFRFLFGSRPRHYDAPLAGKSKKKTRNKKS